MIFDGEPRGATKVRGEAVILEGCAVATVDGAATEYREGHIVIQNDMITAVGEGPADEHPGARRIDARGCLATPGLVNCHHHLYQWATRGLAQQATLFEWLTEAQVAIDIERASRRLAARTVPSL
jgi:cytosine/adenosine deaminase-related metal-dependent hydrolase